jgi:hypothetical protein
MGVHIAIHAAAEQARRENEEEEYMTQYRPQDLNGAWEFKILRSATGAFKRPETFGAVVAEENLGGWELLEKFDNKRLRFHRPISARKDDAMRQPGYDPYRTQIGISESALGIALAVAIIAISLGVIGLIAMTQGGF